MCNSFALRTLSPFLGEITVKLNVNKTFTFGVRGGVVVKALRYKPTGRGFNSRWCHWKFSVT